MFCMFEVGQVVHHLRYKYRGVIVARDACCTAPEEWYSSNRTQPARNQPWYHVLVDQGLETYVAEENLEVDDSERPIDHELVASIFPTFHKGQYYRQSLN